MDLTDIYFKVLIMSILWIFDKNEVEWYNTNIQNYRVNYVIHKIITVKITLTYCHV